jgi:hypothetical protein
MALVKLGALAQDVRGSIAGTTFSKSRAGATTRQKVSPSQPRTARQTAIRAIMTNVSQAWRNLSQDMMASWTSWSNNHPIPNIFGDPIKLAPNAAFVRVNADLLNVAEVWGGAMPFPLTLPLSAPPVDPTVLPASPLSVTANASSGVVTVTTETQTASSGFYALWVTRGYSLGVKHIESLLKLGATLPVMDAGTTLVATPSTNNPLISFQTGQAVTVVVCRYAASGKLIDTTRLDCVAMS